jgi:hypothetical protein
MVRGSWGAVVVVAVMFAARAEAQMPPPPVSTGVRGCTFSLAAVVEPGSMPPLLDVVLVRSNCGGELPDASVVLGSTYGTPALSVAGHGQRLAASFTHKASPSGEAHASMEIFAIDPVTLALTQRTTLAAESPDAFHPNLGNVYTGNLTVRGMDLLVTGSFDGIIPGMNGSGTEYLATYDDFFSGGGPAPSSVEAF